MIIFKARGAGLICRNRMRKLPFFGTSACFFCAISCGVHLVPARRCTPWPTVNLAGASCSIAKILRNRVLRTAVAICTKTREQFRRYQNCAERTNSFIMKSITICNNSAPRKNIRERDGELAHCHVLGYFSEADKARSASVRVQSRMRSIWDCVVLNSCFYSSETYNRRVLYV